MNALYEDLMGSARLFISILCICSSLHASACCDKASTRYTAIGAGMCVTSFVGFGLGVAGVWITETMKLECNSNTDRYQDICAYKKWQNSLMNASMVSMPFFFLTGLVGAVIFLEGRKRATLS